MVAQRTWENYGNEAIRLLYPRSKDGVDYLWGSATPGATPSLVRDNTQPPMVPADIQAHATFLMQTDPYNDYDTTPDPRPEGGPIVGLSPDTAASLAAAGIVGRTIATMSIVGGKLPAVFTIANAGGVSCAFTGADLKTTVNPAGTAGAKTIAITATDAQNQTKTENLAVTLT
jgi:hypothetical protein